MNSVGVISPCRSLRRPRSLSDTMAASSLPMCQILNATGAIRTTCSTCCGINMPIVAMSPPPLLLGAKPPPPPPPFGAAVVPSATIPATATLAGLALEGGMLTPPFNAGRTQYLANLLPLAQAVNLTVVLANPHGMDAPFVMDCWADQEEAQHGPDWLPLVVNPTVTTPGHLTFSLPPSIRPRVCELYYYDHQEHPAEPHSIRYMFLLSPLAALNSAELAEAAAQASGGRGGGGGGGFVLGLLAFLAGGTGVVAAGMQLSQWTQTRRARDRLANDFGLGAQPYAGPLGDSEYSAL